MSLRNLPTIRVLNESGSVLRREALDAGMSPDDVRGLLSAGTWVRIRRGAYADRRSWTALSPEQRHLVLARAVLRALEEPAVLAHVSAAVAHGLPVWGADLRTVHVLRPSRRHGSRTEAGVVHHSAALPDEHWVYVNGLPVTSPTRTIIDHARTTPFEPAVTTADAALHDGLVTPEGLRAMLAWQQDWPGARAAGRVVGFADGGSESVGESRGRIRMDEAGLPAPELQVEITDALGLVVARVDFLFRAQRTIVEFDGRLKYRLETSERDLEEVVWLEKLREYRLRALGYAVVRITWADLERGPAWLRRRILDAFALASAQGIAP